jgi:two-component system, NarL family, invasion response regulator UvrY
MEKHITVLIADDNSNVRESLRSVVSYMKEAKLIGEAANGEDAIKLAKELLPDIILMDINMSPVNGFEATRKIIKDNPQARIIGLSDNKKNSYIKNMLQLGAKGYIIKGSSFEIIIEAIKKVNAGERFVDKEIDGDL